MEKHRICILGMDKANSMDLLFCRWSPPSQGRSDFKNSSTSKAGCTFLAAGLLCSRVEWMAVLMSLAIGLIRKECRSKIFLNNTREKIPQRDQRVTTGCVTFCDDDSSCPGHASCRETNTLHLWAFVQNSDIYVFGGPVECRQTAPLVFLSTELLHPW